MVKMKLLQGRIEMQAQRMNWWTWRGGRNEGGIIWEVGVEVHALPCVKQICCIAQSLAPCSVMTQMGGIWGGRDIQEEGDICISSVQFSSVAQSCLTLCDPMNHNMQGLPVHHKLPEFTQTDAQRVGDAIQPSHRLSSPSPPDPNPSQHQDLFK